MLVVLALIVVVFLAIGLCSIGDFWSETNGK